MTPNFVNRLDGADAADTEPADGKVSDHRRAVARLLVAALVGAMLATGIFMVVTHDSEGTGDSPSPGTPPPVARGSNSGSTEIGRSYDGPAGLVKPGEPCPKAEFGSLSQLDSDAPVYPPANLLDVKRSWNCGDTVVLMVDEVQLSFEAGWGDVDVGRKWQLTIEETGGAIQDIFGRPALVESTEQTDGTSNQVLLVVDGTLIRGLSTGSATADDVVKAVSSLDIKHPIELG